MHLLQVIITTIAESAHSCPKTSILASYLFTISLFPIIICFGGRYTLKLRNIKFYMHIQYFMVVYIITIITEDNGLL